MPDGPVNIEPPKPITEPGIPIQPIPPVPAAAETAQPPQPAPDLESIIRTEAEELLQQEIRLKGLEGVDQQTRLAEFQKQVREKYAKPKKEEGEGEKKKEELLEAEHPKDQPPAQPVAPATDPQPRPEPTSAAAEKTIEEKQAEYRKCWGQGDNSALGHLLSVDWDQLTIPDEKKAEIKAVQTKYKILDQAVKDGLARSEKGVYYIKDSTTGEETPFTQTKEMVNTILTAEDALSADTSNPERAKTATENAQVLRENLTREGFFQAKTNEQLAREKEAEKAKEATKGMFFTGANLVENLAEQIGIKVITRKDDKPDGEITGINQQALDEILNNPENHPSNVHLARLVILVGQYQNISENPQMEQVRHNIATKIYHAIRDFKNLDQITDAGLKDRISTIQKGDEVFATRTTAEDTRLWNEYLTPLGLNRSTANIPVEQSFSYMLSASLFENAVVEIKNAQGQVTGHKFTDEVEAMITNLHYTVMQRQAILALAVNKGESGRYLRNELGFDMETLTGKNMAEFYAKKTAEALESTAVARGKLEYEKGKKDAFEEIFKKLLSDKSLQKILEQREFPKGLTGVLLIIALFLPAAQGVMDTGNETGGRAEGG